MKKVSSSSGEIDTFFEKLVIRPISHVIRQKNNIEDILCVMFIQMNIGGEASEKSNDYNVNIAHDINWVQRFNKLGKSA